jgi:hypothetical protein
MGAQQSVSATISNTINQAMTNVMMNSSVTCSQNNSINLTQGFSNIIVNGCPNVSFSNISQTAQQTPNLACTITSESQTNLLAQFQTQLSQAATSAVSGLGGAVYSSSVSNSLNTLQNVINTKLDINVVITCVQNNLANLTQTWANITINCPASCANTPGTCNVSWNDITQSVVQNAVSSCINQNQDIVSAIATASSDISQSSSSSNTGINIFASLSSFSITSVLIAIGVFLAIIVIGFIIYKLVSRKKGPKVAPPTAASAPPATGASVGAGKYRFRKRF